MSDIHILGAEEHNLKSVNVRIPKRSLVAFTGVSGSGKSSLIFDTLFAESYRRYADASQVPVHLMGRQSSAAPGRRPRFHAIRGLPPALGLSQRQGVAGRLSTVGTLSGVADLLRVYFAAFGEVSCRKCDIPLKAMTFADVVESIKTRFAERRITIFAPIAERRKGAFAEELERFRRNGFTRVRLNGQVVRLDSETDEVRLDARKLNTVELLVDAFQMRPERAERAERAVAQAVDFARLVKVEAELGGGASSAPNLLPSAEVYNLSSACPQCGESAPKLDPRYFSNTSLGRCEVCEGSGESDPGLPADLFPCQTCHGSRLNPAMPLVRVQAKTFAEVTSMTLAHVGLLCSAEKQRVTDNPASRARLKVLDEVLRLTEVHKKLGIDHLTIGRSGSSLAPGDLQRLRLASLLANRLRGAVYVLDEPCQGLTKEEVDSLASLLRTFVADGCSVIAVEHHPIFLRAADHVFVMGPGAGSHGGEITSHVTGQDYATHHTQALAKMALGEFSESPESISQSPGHGMEGHLGQKPKKASMQALKHVPTKAHKKSRTDEAPQAISSSPAKQSLLFSPATLRGVSFPAVSLTPGTIHVLRGRSGSGKSTFINYRLAPVLASQCEEPDPELQSVVSLAPEIWSTSKKDSTVRGERALERFGVKLADRNSALIVKGIQIVRPGSLVRSSRRSVAAALDVLVPLRDRFESLVSSQVLGLTASDFSWNSKKGQCPECSGRGYLEYEQKYAPPIEVTCPSCNGTKLGRQSLLPRLRGKNFAEVLDLSLEQAAEFFANDRQILSRLESALEFGLDYIQLSQSMESLSGGEMQRLILTLDLKRVRVEGFWYLLTHPGTGLHLPDIQVLGQLMRRLVERGATFVLTENREEFSSFADCIIQF